MAQVIWAEPALNDLDAIADYIALDNPEAARRLVQKIFKHVENLEHHPKLGSKPQELKGWRYRQIVEPPCRIFYREDSGRVLILHVMRSERLLNSEHLAIETTCDNSAAKVDSNHLVYVSHGTTRQARHHRNSLR
jgi:toxin ParE1/3/4